MSAIYWVTAKTLALVGVLMGIVILIFLWVGAAFVVFMFMGWLASMFLEFTR